MILLALSARNFMKFESLSLMNLPENGVVGIIGDNESGKTTVFEAITFALFGRTIKAESADYARLIQWKAPRLEVRLDFLLQDKHYRVVRIYDRQGGREATLYEISDDKEIFLFDGVSRVETELFKLYPVSFEMFRQSFYLGQKELASLYENRATSSQIMDQMTGLDRLKIAHQKIREQLPQKIEDVIAVEKEISVCHVSLQHYAEGLREKPSLEQDLLRQEERLKEILHQERESEFRLQWVQNLKGSLDSLEQSHLRLRKAFTGFELQERLKQAGSIFRSGFRHNLLLLEEKHKDLRTADENLLLLQKKVALANELAADLIGIQHLVKERIEHIEKDQRSHFGSQNVRSYFSPSTLKDRSVVIDCQTSETRARSRLDVSAYNWSLLLLLLLCGGLVFFGLNVNLEDFKALNLSLKTGLILFFISVAGLLGSLLFMKHRSIQDSRETIARLQMSRNLLDKELLSQLDELSGLNAFSLGAVTSVDSLIHLRSNIVYEPIRQHLALVIEKAQAKSQYLSENLAELGLLQEQFEALNQKRSQVLKERAELQGLIEANRPLAEKLERLSFLSEVLPSERWLEQESIVRRLIDLLAGDYSHSVFEVERLTVEYQKGMQELLTEAKSHADLMPAVFDEKRLRFELQPDRLKDLELMALLDKFKTLDEQQDYFQTLKQSWQDRLHKCREINLREDMARQTAEQRIAFMRESLQKLSLVGERQEECGLRLEALQKDLTSMRRQHQKYILLEDLLKGTIESLQARLSPNMARFVGNILPLITNNRYSRVKVSLGLEISVYSPEKEGYVDFTTLSGGTADQLLVCLRLAFASSLIQSGLGPKTLQFLCLDEPLGAFDAQRSQKFLEMILEYNPNFAQVFLITHNPALSSHFALTIQTEGSKNSLSLS